MKRGVSQHQLEAAAIMFGALADQPRLQTLIRLAEREHTVTELAAVTGEKVATVSARLKVLFTARLVKRVREGQSIRYSIADKHVLDLVRNAIDHASH